MFNLGPVEIVVIGAIAVMLYGKRLPEVGRTVGKTVGDLRRQWTNLARDLEVAADAEARAASLRGSGRSLPAARHDDDEGGSLVAGPRFDPPDAAG